MSVTQQVASDAAWARRAQASRPCPTGIPDEDLYTVAISGLVVLGVVFLLHKELVAVSLARGA